MTRKQTALAKLAAAPHILWSLIFILAPMIFVVYYAFTDANGAFTLANMNQLSNYGGIFIRSVSFALIATAVCFILAYPIAYFVAQMKTNVQATMIMLIMVPMWINLLIRTYSWMALLEDTGVINTILSGLGLKTIHMINTPGAVILGMVYDYLPFMILPIYSVMAKLDASLVEAAKDLGCNSFKVLTSVIFPLSISGVVSGITMVFVPSISTFYISQKLGGGNYDLIGDTIERQFQSAYNYNLGAAISLVLMILILISIAVMNHYADSEEGIVV